MNTFNLLKASLFVMSTMLVASPAMAQDDHDHGAMEMDQPAAPVDPNAIQGSIAEPQSVRGEHRVQLEAGRRYMITVNTEAFDAMLKLKRGSEEIAADDDSGGGTTPRIIYTPTASGEFVVEVSSFSPSGHGDYALSVTPQAPLPALVTRPARTERGAWRVYTGSLAASDPADRERKFDDYELRLTQGQVALIRVQSDADTMLQVFKADERGLTPLAENDDTDGLNPFLFFSPGEAGTYVVRVMGFDASALGNYTLRIGN